MAHRDEKNVKRCCAYCKKGTAVNDQTVICARNGVVSIYGQCRSFRYDSSKRKMADPPGRSVSASAGIEGLGGNLGFAAAEAYKLLRTNLLFALPDENHCRIVGVTSSCSGEGKSTTALNLAYMLASAGKWTLLIEADMRLPTISKRLKIENKPGLSNLLVGMCGVDAVIRSSSLHDQLRVVPSGDIPPNPSELLGSKRMLVALSELAKDFDFILLDLPPVTAVSDALVISKLVHGMIMVVRQDYTSRRMVDEAMRQLLYTKVNILGFVMTYSNALVKGGKYGHKKGYGYGYGYGYGAYAQTGTGEHGSA